MAVVAVLVAVSLLLGALILLISAALVGPRPRPEAVGSGAAQEESNNVGNGVTEKQTTSKKQKVQRFRKERLQQHVFSHPVLAATLKGHSGNISCLDFSSNGKYLASCSDDRTVRIWSTKDFLERDHRCMRANVDLDHATHVRFSPDSRAFITWLANEETVRVFKMTKKDDGSLTFSASVDDFPKKHRFPIVNISIAETGKFIMSAASDTTILIWDLKGEVMATINTNQMNNAFATVSPCGRFVASCGFTPDVKVWEVCFTKSGEFQEVLRAFDLKGHSAGVYSFAFSNDSRRMATVSKDGTWKLWDTDVEYKKQQDPYLLLTIKCDVADPCRIALSPDARVVAISSGFNISVYNAKTGEKEEEFLNVHGEEIVELAFDVNSRFLVSSGDRAIRVFHNVVGYRAVITEMEAMLKRPTSEAMRERLQRQISNAQSALDSVCIKQQQRPQTL